MCIYNVYVCICVCVCVCMHVMVWVVYGDKNVYNDMV